MKRALVLLVVLALAGGVSYGVVVKGRRAPVSEHVGGPSAGAPLVPIYDAQVYPEKYAGTTIRVEGKIVRQCPNSGCWFDLKSDKGDPLRVDMGHLGLKFPQRGGYTASVEGKLFQGKQRVELIGENVDFIKPQ